MKSLLLIATLSLATAVAQDAQQKSQPTVAIGLVNSQLLKLLSFAPANSTPYVAVFILNGTADGYRVSISYVDLADGQTHTASQDVANGHLGYFAVDAVGVSATVCPYTVAPQSIKISVP